ncbi:MAG: MlaD family protein [Gemmatimonadota bacterium]|nr:MlaD family protein [Gemmatimonadota bacterium]
MQQNTRVMTTVVGISIFLAFLIVVWTIFFLQGYITRRNSAIFSASFDQAGQLEVGDNVTLAGVPVGRVEFIGLEGLHAGVRFTVDRRIRLPRGTRAVIQSGDVFGECYLQLVPGQGPPLEPGSRMEGELAPGFQDAMNRGIETMDQAGKILKRVGSLIIRLEEFLEPQSSLPMSLENVETLTDNARDFSEHLDSYGRLLERVLVSVDSAALSMKALATGNAEGIKSSVTNLKVLTARLDTLTAGLESGQGTIGRLMRDEKLYEDLQDVIREARILIAEFREHPDRFLKLNVF